MRRLELNDLYRIPQASDPRLSPDGTRVAFVVTTIDRDKDANRSAIWMALADGSEPPRQLTTGDRDSSPRWSPDGRWLAFVAARGEEAKPQIWLLPMNGGEAHAVTARKNGAGSPVWSPDSQRIAFVAVVDEEGDDGGAGNDAGDKDPTEANRPVVVTTVQYKSDGRGLLGRKRAHLFVCVRDGGESVQLTSGDYSVGAPSWSPDGTRITFAAARHEQRDLDLASHVFVVDAAGGEPRAVTSGLTSAAAPVFSPDGRSILYAGDVQIAVGHTRLLLVEADGDTGQHPVELAHHLDRNVMIGGPAYPGAPPGFTPDGTIVFCARDLGCTHIYRAGPDGSVTKLIGDEWSSAAGVTLSADGSSMAFVLSTPATCGEVWVSGVERGDNARQLSHLVAGALDDVELIRPEARQFQSADGTAVSGWILCDPAANTSGPRPLLLDVHGGPHNAWNPCFDGVHLYHQVLAAEGWAVLFINPRGSDGYGESFYTGLIKDGWGRADTDDFLSAIDAVVSEGVADPDRLAVAGYSYGGYMTCWLTATTGRFAAAVAGGVVSNLASFSGTSDIGIGFARLELGVMPWDDPDRLAACSPSTFVHHVRTPTLIVHGEHDDRCPIGQSEEWFSALRAQGIDTELVRYPGASHLFVLNGPPSQRIDWCRRIIDWVARAS